MPLEFSEHVMLALAGGIGAVCRYVITLWFPGRGVAAILVVNLLGSLLLGISLAMLEISRGGVPWFALSGFCGGFTTFSTFAVQARDIVRNGSLSRMLALCAVHVALCTAAALFGWFAVAYALEASS